MATKVIFSSPNDGELHPQTSADNVIIGNTYLSERILADGIVMKDSITNQYKKLSISNGTVSVTDYVMPTIGYNNVLCIGNSITLHGITSYWWGRWGMAASQRQNDWVHQLQSKLQIKNPDCHCYALNVATPFEQDDNGDLLYCIENGAKDFDTLDLTTVDLVIIRLGENGLKQTPLENLVDSIRNNISQDVEIVITGMFWTDATKENVLSSVAQSKDCTFVQINQYNTSIYKSNIGTQVYGDDNQWHTINNSGVAAHPNDAGMEAIADSIFDVLALND